jgi:hypothetical protein
LPRISTPEAQCPRRPLQKLSEKGSNGTMTYASEHEKELSYRSYRFRVEIYRAALRPSSEVPRTTEDPQSSRNPKRCLLYLEEWMSLAVTSPRISTLEDHLPLLPRVEDRRHLRKTQRSAARALADLLRKESPTQRRDSRLAVGQDNRGGWRTEGIRRRKEDSWQEAPSLGGYGGIGPKSQGAQCENPRAGWPKESCCWSRRVRESCI